MLENHLSNHKRSKILVLWSLQLFGYLLAVYSGGCPYCCASGPQHRAGYFQGERVIESPDSMSLAPLWEKDVTCVVLCWASVIQWSLGQYFHSLFSYKLDYSSSFERYTQFYCASSVSFSLFLLCGLLFVIVSLNWKYMPQIHQTVNTGQYFLIVFLLRNTIFI